MSMVSVHVKITQLVGPWEGSLPCVRGLKVKPLVEVGLSVKNRKSTPLRSPSVPRVRTG